MRLPLRIGLDFDNTIVSYDALFHKVAREQELVPPDTPVNKVAVRDYLRKTGQEHRWTQMQGEVYGARMGEAQACPGVIDFILQAKNAGYTIAIVSHKTRHPFVGPQYDLHAAASEWIAHHLLAAGEPLIPAAQVFFELTKHDKVARIAGFACDVYIDDLPEILLAEGFPTATERLLFDPDQHHAEAVDQGLKPFVSWTSIADYIFT